MGKDTLYERIYALVALIPRGQVATYGQIGAAAGGLCGGRVVGFAMARAPAALNLPCHRVVNRLGQMAPGPVFGGAEAQRRRLMKEGVRFRPDGAIDLEQSRCDFDALRS